MTRPTDLSDDQPSLVEAELTPAEVVELWSFVHGDIMEGGIRQLLRAALGLCPRHTWGYAATEIELWQTGAGARGGHQPFDVSVLYEDLLDHVAARLRRPAGLFHRDLRHILVPRTECRICNTLRPAGIIDERAAPVGYAGATAADLARETNQLTYTTQWCRETQPQWQSTVCPHCATTLNATPQQVPTGGNGTVLCRLHLLDLPLTPQGADGVAAHLNAIAGRLRRLGTSMTKDGPAATADDDASWVQALGWFAGWRVPLTLTGAART